MTVESLLSENTELKSYIKSLEVMVKLLRHRQFTPKSERFISDEQMMFDEIEALAREFPPEDDSEQIELIEVEPHKRKKPKRKKFPKELPREVVTIELPEDQRKCPNDGTDLKVALRGV